MSAPTVGVIGLGAMGKGIAQTLRSRGHALRVCDARPGAAAAFAAEGGTACADPAEVARGCDVVVSVVVNAAQTEDVLFGDKGCAAAMAPGSVFVMCSTVDPNWSIALEARLAELEGGEAALVTASGQGATTSLLWTLLAPGDEIIADKTLYGCTFGYLNHGLAKFGVKVTHVDLADPANLDAPISGGAAKAASGQMTMMTAGTPAAYAKAGAVLDAMAGKVYRLGDKAGAGSKVKIINQLLAGVHIAAAAEAMALGLREGVDAAALYEVITHSAGNSWMFENRMAHVLAGDYTPLSAVDIFVKDLGLVLDTARATKFPLPLASTAHQMFMQASTAGFAREDDSAVIKIFPGITLPEPGKG